MVHIKQGKRSVTIFLQDAIKAYMTKYYNSFNKPYKDMNDTLKKYHIAFICGLYELANQEKLSVANIKQINDEINKEFNVNRNMIEEYENFKNSPDDYQLLKRTICNCLAYQKSIQ